MKGYEKRRLEERIMHMYSKLQTKKSKYGADQKMKKINELEQRIVQILDGTKITKMAEIRQDKLKALYKKWMAEKEK